VEATPSTGVALPLGDERLQAESDLAPDDGVGYFIVLEIVAL
jgi:hypothetical protein